MSHSNHEKLDTSFTIKCKSETKTMINLIAAADDLSPSDWVRMVLDDAIQVRRKRFECEAKAFGLTITTE